MAYRDGVELRTEDHVHFVLSHGALGDMISSLPAIVWARENHTSDMTMTAWVPTRAVELVQHLIGRDGLEVQPLEKFEQIVRKDKVQPGACVVNYSIKDTITRNKHDMVRFAFSTMLDREIESIDEMNYPHWAKLGPRTIERDYAVLPVGATNRASTFHASLLQPIAEWLLAQGLTPVLTGKRGRTGIVMMSAGKPIPLEIHDEVKGLPEDLLAKCVDLRDRTDLMRLRDVCGHARIVVGIDGGTLHLAGTTDVPIVYGCTRVDPFHRGIVRHGEGNWRLIHVTPYDLACAGCQSHWTLMFRFNFAECGYKDFKCASSLRAADFIEATDILLRETENA